MVDPYNCDYNLIRNQNHIVDLPENVEDILHYNGQIQMNLTNGDIFSGNFEDGEREGFGVLTFGLIHKVNYSHHHILMPIDAYLALNL